MILVIAADIFYIYNISSGKILPPMKEFLAICDYFGITPMQFFDDTLDKPELIQSTLNKLLQLGDTDLQLVTNLIDRLNKQE